MRTKTTKQNKINVVTLGCSKNVYDSEVLMGQLKANGKEVVHEDENDDGNIVVINTCGFIGKAKEESVETILHYAQKKEEGEVDKVFVTGCLSERYKPDLEAEITNVDQYFGTHDLPNLLKVLEADYKHELIGERLTTTPEHYAYLKIAEGCDRPCSFCAIPLMRGKHKSTPIEDLVTEATKLAEKGIKEIMLIAQDLTYYGLDIYKKRALADLLKELVKVEGIEWIRLHYAFPTGFPMDVLEVMKNEPKVCNYLDIPLQHINTEILKSMKRGTTHEKTTSLIHKFREAVPNMAIRTTLIVGYPGETEEQFQELKDWVEEMRFERLGAFEYSHEENTGAYVLEDDVPADVKFRRVNEIMEVQSQISWELNQEKIGKTFKCLFDRKDGEYYYGRTEFDSPDVDNDVIVDAREYYIKLGEFIDIEIFDAGDFDLHGKPVVKQERPVPLNQKRK
ncbi:MULTISPECIES: 30S ribosomal protein S12 methylthiotransferase RimO [Tenacibaculum]|uniref:Ribosomal protein uS12 methylthiotransferase RimO n=1 Tax=Tenacibaculum mesophilum TaxID=104268 RepID=A0ABM7CEF9_9FLAO|nr:MULTISPECIES: 30S ribosomal protein S12 methylthiotransferase RimO [Tenacibaculum]AZJ32133.1 30S ribosomal protein S12 methylthiotransferase RimO [Tenacibaculum mesophilum]MCO7186686.1 30S ribosomal protein S12 methylthiotransferase RimO [Tenacibaculum sp. XPcli2-G]QFS27393.1 30S ribosomal protein S12 methylthiotransferase RimO [Tenacibaculum mesophilum]SHF90571.1 SSU ribosomal protein S12P methylthiotransferase [Tenacibaculum mesophilum]BFF41590.1 30S ribosomal protein S12 methylthiotransf|eukprot:TRINITY_DN5125_c0_g1_i1.p1 TRINITY_DN5125_c0_g1~~TRINITY_DN5125_c0_g1_i1.p1  ORF type:complete len:451 (+),score=100.90 TRINITY_DN5125_c0_g1_i1:245-1597(+)